MRAVWSALTGKQAGLVAVIVLALLCAYGFGYRGMRFFLVPSSSMEPTLMREDHLVTLRYPEYRRGDLVVLRDHFDGGFMVKRIVGVGGDVLSVAHGALFIDGEYASEPYIMEPMLYVFDRVEVPEGRVFLLGDNRNASEDSRTTGDMPPVEDIVGRVVFTYFPYERWGYVPSYPLINNLGR